MLSFSAATGSILIIFGLFCLWQGWKNFGLARASRGWTPTTGTITQVKLRKITDSENQYDYEAVVTYRYPVGKLEFRCSTISIGKESIAMSEKESLTLDERFPLHTHVRVFYDPANPARAVLEQGKEGNSVLLLAVGAGLAVFGCVNLSL